MHGLLLTFKRDSIYSFCFNLDRVDGAHTTLVVLCSGDLRRLRRSLDLLLGNPAEIRARHDCSQFWLLVQLGLAVSVLHGIRKCVLGI